MSKSRVGGRPAGQGTTATNEQVFAVIVERYTTNPPAPTSKRNVQDALGASQSSIDSHFERLVDRKLIRFVENGFYIPVNVFQDRPVSMTTVPGGRHKMEMGDHVVEFSPRELSDLVALSIGLVSR